MKRGRVVVAFVDRKELGSLFAKYCSLLLKTVYDARVWPKYSFAESGALSTCITQLVYPLAECYPTILFLWQTSTATGTPGTRFHRFESEIVILVNNLCRDESDGKRAPPHYPIPCQGFVAAGLEQGLLRNQIMVTL